MLEWSASMTRSSLWPGFSFDSAGAARHLPAELRQSVADKFRCVLTDYVTPLDTTVNSVHEMMDVRVSRPLTQFLHANFYAPQT